MSLIDKQATINIGTTGHVGEGKSTLVKRLTGVDPIKFKKEKIYGITIKLGYANAKIYKCNTDRHYTSKTSNAPHEFPCTNDGCTGTMELKRHVSFTDCPGHNTLMSTMLNGTSVMDAAILLISANEPCPQPQTMEHLAALEIMQLKNIIVLQNKIDLVKKSECLAQYQQIKDFLKGTIAENAPIIPISAQTGINTDIVCEYICEYFSQPEHDYESEPHFTVVRSFDVNKPGSVPEKLIGGIAGGTLTKGTIKLGDSLELRPGYVKKNGESFTCTPIKTKVISMFAEKNSLDIAVPGGLIGIGTDMDPSICRENNLVGQIIGHPGKLPNIYHRLEVNYFLMKRVIGDADNSKVKKLRKGEKITINICSRTAFATVIASTKDLAKLDVDFPICADIGDRITISRNVASRWRLIGWAKILSGD